MLVFVTGIVALLHGAGCGLNIMFRAMMALVSDRLPWVELVFRVPLYGLCVATGV